MSERKSTEQDRRRERRAHGVSRWRRRTWLQLGVGRIRGLIRMAVPGPRVPGLVLALAMGLARPADSPVGRPTFHANLQVASEAAAADHTLVLLVFSAEWCAPCKVLKRTVLDTTEFLERAGPLHATDVDVDANSKTARGFAVQAVPTLLLLTADQTIVARRQGFVDAPGLIAWIEEGRRRVQQGQWEGTASGPKLDEFVTKAAVDRLTAVDLKRLVALLDESDPAERAAAGRLLLAQREAAVPLLLEAVADTYLGRRIAASELLRRLAPTAPPVDPWQSPAELTDTLAALQQWWRATGRLPPATEPVPLAPFAADSLKAAVEALRGEDPVARTEAMSTLTEHGLAGLPRVREAIQQSERDGHSRATALLEDVRWAVLVPDRVELRTGGVRAALARGTSPERQEAAARLQQGGREAIPALGELVNDADPLVIESAVRALSGIGGNLAVPAMAALLQAADSNLRMTAAQALGHARNTNAMPPLLASLVDPHEVVVCTALSAIEELHSSLRNFLSKRPLATDLVVGLKKCLADDRWRVRAAAAEVAGKLNAAEVRDDLTKLLDDPDGFVVKNALAALSEQEATPTPPQLGAIARRHAGLRGEVVALLLATGRDESSEVVADLYRTGGTEERLDLLHALSSTAGELGAAWTPLLTQAAAEPDARLRRAATEALGSLPAKPAAELLEPRLNDEDAETRTAAVAVVLSILGGEPLPRGSRVSARTDMISFARSGFALRTATAAQTNDPPATAAQRRAWHTALEARAGPTPTPAVAAALYVTGSDRVSDLPMLQAALDRAEPADRVQFAQSPALAAILPRLPWPEGQPVLERLCGTPALFVRTLERADRAMPALVDYLHEPARFRAAVEPASGEELSQVLTRLLIAGDRHPSLDSDQAWVPPVVTALLQATNAAWRAAAVHVLSHGPHEVPLATLEPAARDPNPWVRMAVVRALARAAKDRATLEARLEPMLHDADPLVVRHAALGLLEPELRQAAGLDAEFDSTFRFGDVQVSSGSTHAEEQRPLTLLDHKPPFLDHVRAGLASAGAKLRAPFALLLAQYGDFSGVDRLVAGTAGEQEESDTGGAPALAGIALSHDPKYLPYLRKVADKTEQPQELAPILQALKGFTGTSARGLRLEINRRIRGATE